jgi:AI-2 transport protein TqsA
MDGLQRYLKLPQFAALVVVLAAVVTIIGIVGGMVASSAAELASRANEYEAEIEKWVSGISDRLPLDDALFQRLGIDADEGIDLFTILPEDGIEVVIGKLTSTIGSLLSQGTLVMLFVIFILSSRRSGKTPQGGMAQEIFERIQKYIATKITVSAMTGVAVFLMLQFLGVPYALAFGAFAFLLNFVPSVGSIIATTLPIPVILLTPEISGMRAVSAIVLPGLLQFAVGNIIEPKIMGKSLDLHPVVILMALIFWGMLWGPTGMLLAIPLTATAKIVLEQMDLTVPVANALAGRLNESNAESVDARD